MPVSVELVIESGHICIVLSNGDIVTYDVTSESIECVGSISTGIQACAWNVGQDRLVLVTASDSFVLMSNSYDPIIEKEINAATFGTGQAVNVGWGSKQTQFHGSEGKSAAKVTSQVRYLD